MLFYLLWALAVRVRQFMRIWMPTNILLDHLRTRRARSRDLIALGVGLGYLGLAIACAGAVEHGRTEWLNLGVLLCFWNASKFILFIAITHLQNAVARIRNAAARPEQQRADSARRELTRAGR
ncbi:sulfate permease [Microbacterium sp. NPDC077663]|uniref:sulfate permease n=1 Tax=Microbacterium sp. NPDC077663 TaxID=3364189 RepID=UPI0037C5DE4D